MNPPEGMAEIDRRVNSPEDVARWVGATASLPCHSVLFSLLLVLSTPPGRIAKAPRWWGEEGGLFFHIGDERENPQPAAFSQGRVSAARNTLAADRGYAAVANPSHLPASVPPMLCPKLSTTVQATSGKAVIRAGLFGRVVRSNSWAVRVASCATYATCYALPSPPMPSRSLIRCTRCNDSGLRPSGKPGAAQVEPCTCAKGRAIKEGKANA